MVREQELMANLPKKGRVSAGLVTSSIEFAALREEWRALVDESDAAVFNSWEWLYPWYGRLGREESLRILAARDAKGKLLGLLPLALQSRKVLGVPLRRLHFLADDSVGSDYLDMVCAPDNRPEVAHAFAAELKAAKDNWDVLELSELPADSPSIPLLRDAFRKDFHVVIEERYRCPYERMARVPFDAFLARTARKDNYLRRRRWLERQEGFSIEKTEAPERVPVALSEFFSLHRSRWQSDGGSQGVVGPEMESFHREAAALLAEEKKLRLYTMKLGKQPVASVYALMHRGKFYYYQSGYHPDWSSKSVGLVLVGETFKDCCESGFTEYDFLHGEEAYKFDWTTKTRATVRMRVFLPGGAGAFFIASQKARARVKKVLPPIWLDSISRFRRRLEARKSQVPART